MLLGDLEKLVVFVGVETTSRDMAGKAEEGVCGANTVSRRVYQACPESPHQTSRVLFGFVFYLLL